METDPYSVSDSDRAGLQELMQQHDVVWVHTLRTANWFRFHRWPHSVLDVDDLASSTYQSAAQSGRSPVRRLLDLRMAWIWRRRERILADRFDVLTVCSEFMSFPTALIPLRSARALCRNHQGSGSSAIARSCRIKMARSGSSGMCGLGSSASSRVRNFG
jgi:hypothetical protein